MLRCNAAAIAEPSWRCEVAFEPLRSPCGSGLEDKHRHAAVRLIDMAVAAGADHATQEGLGKASMGALHHSEN